MSFSPVGDHAARVLIEVADRGLRDMGDRLSAAHKIIAEQNAVIAKAHDALRFAFENLTITSNMVGIKKIAAVLAEIEGRR